MKKNNLNKRLTIELMEELHFFDSELLQILKSHGIKNIQDLINADLSKWNGLETLRIIELEEAKKWYDLSRLDNEEELSNEELVALYFEKLDESKKVKELADQLDSELDSMLDEMAAKGLLTEEIISKHGKQLTKVK